MTKYRHSRGHIAFPPPSLSSHAGFKTAKMLVLYITHASAKQKFGKLGRNMSLRCVCVSKDKRDWERSPVLKLGIKNWLNVFIVYLTKFSEKKKSIADFGQINSADTEAQWKGPERRQALVAFSQRKHRTPAPVSRGQWKGTYS